MIMPELANRRSNEAHLGPGGRLAGCAREERMHGRGERGGERGGEFGTAESSAWKKGADKCTDVIRPMGCHLLFRTGRSNQQRGIGNRERKL